MPDYDLGITDEVSVYHYVTDNGKLLCTHYSDPNLEIVKREDTFGMKLCEDCEQAKQISDTYLGDTEV